MKYYFRVLLLVGSFSVLGAELPARAEPYLEAIEKAEVDNGMPSGLLLNLLRNESNFDASIVSHKGAKGIAQIVPKWHPDVDPYDPYESISYAGKYLKKLKTTFGSWSYAVLAYNWGIGNMRKHGPDKAPRESLLLLSRTINSIF